MRLLQRRRSQPLDAVVLQVGLDEILDRSPAEIERAALGEETAVHCNLTPQRLTTHTHEVGAERNHRCRKRAQKRQKCNDTPDPQRSGVLP